MKNNIHEEILMLIRRYENMVRGLEGSIAEETKEPDRSILIARKEAYRLDVIPRLKNLLEETEGEEE